MNVTPEEAAAKMRDRANRVVRMVALEALSRIVLRTPVDTGRARGNWQVGVGEPDRSYAWDQYDPVGTETIAKGRPLLEAAPDGEILFVTNSVPYILPLEHGHSQQAPAGMVGVTIAELRQIAADAVVQIRQVPG